jgi:hypothetical protein
MFFALMVLASSVHAAEPTHWELKRAIVVSYFGQFELGELLSSETRYPWGTRITIRAPDGSNARIWVQPNGTTGQMTFNPAQSANEQPIAASRFGISIDGVQIGFQPIGGNETISVGGTTTRTTSGERATRRDGDESEEGRDRDTKE